MSLHRRTCWERVSPAWDSRASAAAPRSGALGHDRKGGGRVVQSLAGGDMRGYGDDREAVNRAESEQTVAVLAELMTRLIAPSPA